MTWGLGMDSLTSRTLTGSLVTLEPLSMDHVADLRVAAAEGELWRTWYTAVPHPDAMVDEIERRLGLQAEGQMLPWATRLASTGRVPQSLAQPSVANGDRSPGRQAGRDSAQPPCRARW